MYNLIMAVNPLFADITIFKLCFKQFRNFNGNDSDIFIS